MWNRTYFSSFPESVKDVALGNLDGVKFSKQTVEFLVLLTEPTGESKWLKNGKLIEPSAKYQMAIDEEGLLHRMTIDDVQRSDEGIYTFLVLREDVTLRYVVEGGSDSSKKVPTFVPAWGEVAGACNRYIVPGTMDLNGRGEGARKWENLKINAKPNFKTKNSI